MGGIIVVLGGLLVLGIFLMSGMKVSEKKTREQFLRDFAKFLEGTLEPIEGSESSFSISFCYEGQNFIYEDVEEVGFKDTTYSARLKVFTSSGFSLSFTEKLRTATRSEIFKASDIFDDPSKIKKKLKVPKELYMFDIFVNDIQCGQRLFEDPKMLNFLKRFKGADSRGFPFMTIKSLDGVIQVTFRPSGKFYPRPPYLEKSMDEFEALLDNLLKMAAIISDKKSSE